MNPLARDENNIAGIGGESTITRTIIPAKVDPSTNRLLVDSLSSLPTGAATSAKQDTQTTLLQGIAGFTVTGYDYIGATYPNTSTEVYTYKTGGSGGSTIATITVVYSDAVTKQIITSVTKT